MRVLGSSEAEAATDRPGTTRQQSEALNSGSTSPTAVASGSGAAMPIAGSAGGGATMPTAVVLGSDATPIAVPRLKWTEYVDKFRGVIPKRGTSAVLGEGTYGKVTVTRRKDTGELLAIKTAKADISSELEMLSLLARIVLNDVLLLRKHNDQI